jgi:hypothetical protein
MSNFAECSSELSSTYENIEYMSVAKVPAVFKVLASVFVFIVALLAFVRWLFIEPTMDFTVPSPDGAAAIVKTYTDEPFVEVTLVQRGIFGRSYSLGSFPSPTEFNSDGVIVGWEGGATGCNSIASWRETCHRTFTGRKLQHPL